MNLTLMPLYRFWVEVAISIIVLVFSFYTLAVPPTKGANNKGLAGNLIFLVIGYWIPSNSTLKKEGQTIENSEQTIYVEKSKE